MNEVSKQDCQHGTGARARRKRIVERVIRFFGLLGALFWLLIYCAMMQTGYLSSIGIVVGAFLAVSGTIGSVAGLAGRERLERLLSWLWGGTIILILVAAMTVLLGPEDRGAWRPYRFDDALAALEAARAIPDADNAALRYESALATLDVNDRPNSIFDGAFVRDELGQNPWKAAEHPEASEWLDSHAKTVEELLPVGQIEKCRWPVLADWSAPGPVPYERLRRAEQLLLMAGNRDLGDGRPQRAIEKYACVLRNAEHFYQQTDFVDFFYGLHHEHDALLMIRRVLVEGQLSQRDMKQIAGCLPTAENTWWRDISQLQRFEELRFVRLLAPIYEVNARGEVRFAGSFPLFSEDEQPPEHPSRMERLWRLYWLANMPIHPGGVWDMARKKSADCPQLLGPGQTSFLRKESSPPHRPFFTTLAKVLANGARFVVEDLYVDEYRYVTLAESYGERIAERRGTWLVLGLRRYREAHGAWPDRLDEVSSYVPPEAFADPVTGGAFVYARDGDSFRLYSKGSNRIDEGGRCYYVRALDKVEDDIPLWPPPPPPEPPDPESLKKELEAIYGRGYERYFKLGTDGPNKSTNQSGVKASPRKEE